MAAGSGKSGSAVQRPCVPPGTRIYAIGDSHGCTGKLRALHDSILRDSQVPQADGSPPERLLAVYLGDYIDRGPDSRGLLDILIADSLPSFDRVFLIGNHDIMLLDLIEGAAASHGWRRNGADATLLSYGVDPAVWADGGAAVGEAMRACVPAEHADFLRALRYSHVEGDYFFVHAGVRPGVPLHAQDSHDLIWIRDDFLDSDADHGKIVVHGHTPVRAPEVRANRIGIDTGAVYGDALTALILEGTEHRFLHAG